MIKKYVLIGLSLILIILTGVYFYTSNTSSIVSVERSFDAPIEKVWQHWNDPESIKKWWSPKDYSAPVVQNDLRVGGSFLLSMQAPDGKMFWNTGKYIEIEEHHKIVSRLSFSDEAGNVVPASQYGIPGRWPDEVTVSVEFTSNENKTTVHVQEIGIPLILKFMAQLGWEQQLDKFEQLLKTN